MTATKEVEETFWQKVKAKLEKRWSNMQKRYSKKKNINFAVKVICALGIVFLVAAYEISSQKLNNTLFNSDDAPCEDLSDVNETMFEIALEALKTLRKQEIENDVKQDQDGNWLITVDTDIGKLTADDVNIFNKYINCTEKYRWLHPERNEMTYWIESKSPKDAKRPQNNHKNEAHDAKKQHERHRPRAKQSFQKFRRQGVSHGDMRRIATTSLRIELIFNDIICLKSGNPHVCLHEEEADIAFQARIQRPVAWLGPFKVGQISVVVLKSSNTGNNVLRTKLAIGGADARFTANSFINKFLNAAVVPLVRSHFYDESFAEDIYQHLVEESYLSAQIMQYLYDE